MTAPEGPATTPPAPTPLSLPQRRRSSNYLLLTRVASLSTSSGVEIPLPRPRWGFILPLLGALDALCSASLFIAYARASETRSEIGRNEIAVLVWSGLRAAAVIAATSTRRIRETGWVIVACALISALVALADINLVIQNRPWISGPVASILAAYCLSHLFFGLLHWLAFAAVVGVTAERNPHGLGLRTGTMCKESMRRSASRRQAGPWKERVAHVDMQREALHEEPEDVDEPQEGSSGWTERLGQRHRLNEQSFAELGEDELGSSEEDDLHSDDDYPIDARRYSQHFHTEDTDEGTADERGHIADSDDHQESSDDDPNDIIDIIPSPSGAPRRRAISQSKSLRSRKSFFRSNSGSPEEQTFERGDGSPTGGQVRLNGYGTFRSLAGI